MDGTVFFGARGTEIWFISASSLFYQAIVAHL